MELQGDQCPMKEKKTHIYMGFLFSHTAHRPFLLPLYYKGNSSCKGTKLMRQE